MEEKYSKDKIISALNLLEDKCYSKEIIKQITDKLLDNSLNKTIMLEILKFFNILQVNTTVIIFAAVYYKSVTSYICLEKDKYIYVDPDWNIKILNYENVCTIIRKLKYVVEFSLIVQTGYVKK